MLRLADILKDRTGQAGALLFLNPTRHGGSHLEMSPQYHSASCKDILLFIPLLTAGVGLGGLGGSAVDERERQSCRASPTLSQRRVVHLAFLRGQISQTTNGYH